MSVQSEIDRLNSAKADLKAAIESKGVEVPEDASIDMYAAAVMQIQQDPGYSTTPVDTGKKWIDGKPIYRKVLQFTSPAKSTGNTPVPIGDAVDSFVEVRIILSHEAGYFYQLHQNAFQDSDRIYATLCNNTGSGSQKNAILLNPNADRYANRSGVAVVEYTRAS